MSANNKKLNKGLNIYDKYINEYLMLKLNDLENNNYKTEIINNLIKLRDKYKLLIGDKCQLCINNIVHSIKFIGVFNNKINNINTAIIYCEPEKAIDKDNYYICQHMLQELDTALNSLKVNTGKITLIFNMKNNKVSLNNLKIAYNLYLILKCYLNIIEEILIINSPKLIGLFTSLFNNTFINKIKYVNSEFINNSFTIKIN